MAEVLTRSQAANDGFSRIWSGAPNWPRRYAYRLVITDTLVLCWAVFGAAYLSFDAAGLLVGAPQFADFNVNYFMVGAAMVVVWTTVLAAVGSRNYRVIGTGAEYKAVFQSAVITLLLICLTNFVLKLDFSRRFVLVVLPLGMLAVVVSRLLWRRWLSLHRRRGLLSSRVLLVGSAETTSHIAVNLRRHTSAGYHVVGVLVTDQGEVYAGRSGVPVFRSVDQLHLAVSECQADTVFVTDGHNLPPAKLRELSWSLEPGRQHLVMAPSLADIAGPRVHARPVAGMPLVQVETPRYEGMDRFLKRAFDVLVSARIAAHAGPTAPDRGGAHRLEFPGRGSLRPRAHRQARQAVPDAEVPVDGGRRRSPSGEAARGPGNPGQTLLQGRQQTRGSLRSATSCDATRSTRSRS